MFCCCRRTERRQDAKNDTNEDTLSTEDQKLVREHTTKILAVLKEGKDEELKEISEKILSVGMSSRRKVYKEMLNVVIETYKLPKSGEEFDEVIKMNETARLERFNSELVEEKVWRYTVPESYEAVISNMNDAIKEKQTIRAYTTGYGWTNINKGEGLLMNMSKLKNIKTTLENETFNEKGEQLYTQKHLVWIESGVRYIDVDNLLWPENKRQVLKDETTGESYKMINNTPGFLKLSIVGTAQVGAMGMGSQ
ncbi:hypothetical protein RFI_29478 [Reticulomyxa filosa]|uniref:Uncharacterized protein n=1 Tax=Reticulomyxa filosa TaxID=46433 RepID=X6M1A6_RETFI|nr:hypothetical protein RFI_29478 [Reticulomyxa filosa]|eukprot:ETO07913.1 hypothetical protein RFI_29478 [Reticulomyxa filosa]